MEKVNEYLAPYHWCIEGFYKKCYEKPLSLILKEFSPNDLVLDIGCGDGKLTSIIVPKVKKIMGIDNQEVPIEFAKLIFKNLKINNAKFSVENILTFKSNLKFDKITCFDVIEHLPKDKAEELIKKIYSLLKKEGRLYLTTPNRRSLSNRIFGHKLIDKHYYEYDMTELINLFEKYFLDIKFKGVYVPLVPKTGRYPDIFPFNIIFNFLINFGIKRPSISHTLLLSATKK